MRLKCRFSQDLKSEFFFLITFCLPFFILLLTIIIIFSSICGYTLINGRLISILLCFLSFKSQKVRTVFQALDVPSSEKETEILDNACISWCPERPKTIWIDDGEKSYYDTEEGDDSNDESDGVSTVCFEIVRAHIVVYDSSTHLYSYPFFLFIT